MDVSLPMSAVSCQGVHEVQAACCIAHWTLFLYEAKKQFVMIPLPQGQIPEALGVPSEFLAWGHPVGSPKLQQIVHDSEPTCRAGAGYRSARTASDANLSGQFWLTLQQ